MVRVRVIYFGRVQGVGFRATASAAARDFRVVGFVRNEPDGSVCLEAQGARDQVEGLLAEIARRMERNIERVGRSEAPVTGGERGFGIER